MNGETVCAFTVGHPLQESWPFASLPRAFVPSFS
jgi:hypothetical protein